jgi:hypothetical protein
MAKKSKRSAGVRGRVAGSMPASGEFNPDYTYVKKDLSRIGILAGSFFAILIILSFFLH